MYHNKLLEGHCKVHKMIKVISQLYYFLHIRKKLENYVSKCDLCHKIKSVKHKSHEEIRIASTLAWFWASIIINFIVKLSPSKKFLIKVIYDLILTIVDWLTKKVSFLPYKKASDAKELAYTFLWNVIMLWVLSDEIKFNRD